MKKIIVLIFSVLSFGVSGQIGLFTEGPSQLFHVDAAKNNNNNASPFPTLMADDVVFTQNGKLGLGVINPQAKVHINGTLRVNDGTQANGKLLVSTNNEGLAKWDIMKVNKTSNWKINGTLDVPNVGVVVDLTGTTVVTNNEIENLSAGVNSLKIPRGKYIIIINGDVSGIPEYGSLRVKTSVDIPYSFLYSEWLSGASFMLDLTPAKYADVETITLDFTASLTSVGGVNYYYTQPPYTYNYWYAFSIIQI